MDGITAGGADPSRAADPDQRRVSAVRALLAALDPRDAVAVYTYAGEGELALRNRGAEACEGCDGFLAPHQANSLADGLFPAADVPEAPLWDALIRGAEDARARAQTVGGTPVVIALTAGNDTGSITSPADVSAVLRGAPPVPALVVHLDRSGALDATRDPLPEVAEVAWASGGTYAHVESPDDLATALDTARLAAGARARLTVDLSTALTSPDLIAGSTPYVEVEFVARLAGSDLPLGGVVLPLRVP